MKDRIPHGLLAVALILSMLAGCADDDQQDREIRLAHVLTDNHPVHHAMVRMAELLDEKTQGQLTLNIRHSAQLGAEKELIEKVQAGQIQMTKVSSNALESVVPEMGIFTLPWLFRDEQHYHGVLADDIGQEILAKLETVGLKGLTYYDAGSRSIYARDPIRGIEDLRGLNIRVQPSPTMIRTMEALGAIPKSIPFGPELTQALSRGQLVTAAENNIPSYQTEEHYRSCPHFFMTEHSRAPDVLIMNLRAWESLNDEQQLALQEAAAASAEYHKHLWAEATRELQDDLRDKGVQFTTDVDIAPFVEAVRPIYEQLPDWRREWVERIWEAQ